MEIAEEIQPRLGLKTGVQASLLISQHLCCAHRGTTERRCVSSWLDVCTGELPFGLHLLSL